MIRTNQSMISMYVTDAMFKMLYNSSRKSLCYRHILVNYCSNNSNQTFRCLVSRRLARRHEDATNVPWNKHLDDSHLNWMCGNRAIEQIEPTESPWIQALHYCNKLCTFYKSSSLHPKALRFLQKLCFSTKALFFLQKLTPLRWAFLSPAKSANLQVRNFTCWVVCLNTFGAAIEQWSRGKESETIRVWWSLCRWSNLKQVQWRERELRQASYGEREHWRLESVLYKNISCLYFL